MLSEFSYKYCKQHLQKAFKEIDDEHGTETLQWYRECNEAIESWIPLGGGRRFRRSAWKQFCWLLIEDSSDEELQQTALSPFEERLGTLESDLIKMRITEEICNAYSAGYNIDVDDSPLTWEVFGHPDDWDWEDDDIEPSSGDFSAPKLIDQHKWLETAKTLIKNAETRLLFSTYTTGSSHPNPGGVIGDDIASAVNKGVNTLVFLSNDSKKKGWGKSPWNKNKRWGQHVKQEVDHSHLLRILVGGCHAKCIVSDDTVLIGSTNSSSASHQAKSAKWLETNLCMMSPELADKIWRWANDIADDAGDEGNPLVGTLSQQGI